jgi:hypothetical protein
MLSEFLFRVPFLSSGFSGVLLDETEEKFPISQIDEQGNLVFVES